MSIIKAQIAKLEKGLDNPAVNEGMKAGMRKRIAVLKADLEKEEAKEKEKPEPKEKKTSRGRKAGTKNGDKKEKPKKVKKEKPAKVKLVAKKKDDGAEPTCDDLLERFHARRKASKEAAKKHKTEPVFTPVASHVGDAIAKAIKNTPAIEIKDDPKKKIKQFESLVKKGREFLHEFKSVMGEDFKESAIDKEFKDLEKLIETLEKKYATA